MSKDIQEVINKLEDRIESLRIALEDLAAVNDTLVLLADEQPQRNQSYKTALTYLVDARSELRSELSYLRNQLEKLEEKAYFERQN